MLRNRKRKENNGHSNPKPLISGNWKMHKDHLEAIQTVQKLSYALTPSAYRHIEVSIHPSFTSLRSIQTVLEADRIPISLGAQDCHPEDAGALTGEISPTMLAKLNVSYVIVGHSERRSLFGESSRVVNAKVKAVLRHGMTPIVCVGETLEQRQAGSAEATVSTQITDSLNGIDSMQVGDSVIAYEPIWAIGTGETATLADAQAMSAHIRLQVETNWGRAAAKSLRIQYGGSVKPSNVSDLIAQTDVDGVLVGGASLTAEDFAAIIHNCTRTRSH